MDIHLLAKFLTPCLPFLLKLDNKTSEEAVEQVGEDTWVKAQAIWAKLCPQVEAREEPKDIITDAATNLEYATSQVALRKQLANFLENNPNLAIEISQMLEEAQTTTEDVQSTISTKEIRKPDREGDSCTLPNGTEGVTNKDGDCVPRR